MCVSESILWCIGTFAFSLSVSIVCPFCSVITIGLHIVPSFAYKEQEEMVSRCIGMSVPQSVCLLVCLSSVHLAFKGLVVVFGDGFCRTV